jgi:hypothetical protein
MPDRHVRMFTIANARRLLGVTAACLVFAAVLPQSGAAPPLDVRMCGASGNGTADDAPAFRACVARASAVGGAIVYIPAGTYALKTCVPNAAGVDVAVPLPANVALEGAGWNAILRIANRCVGISNLGNGPATNTRLENFQLDGNKAAVGMQSQWAGDEYSQSCIAPEQAGGMRIEHLYVHGCVQDGIYTGNAPADIVIADNTVSSNGTGATGSVGRGIDAANQPRSVSIVGNRVLNNQGQGILVQDEAAADASSITISGNIVRGNGMRGVDIGDNSVSSAATRDAQILNVSITGNTVTTNTGDGIRIFSACTKNGRGATCADHNVHVSGNTVTRNTAWGVEIAQSAGGVIEGVTVAGNRLLSNTMGPITVVGKVNGATASNNVE